MPPITSRSLYCPAVQSQNIHNGNSTYIPHTHTRLSQPRKCDDRHLSFGPRSGREPVPAPTDPLLHPVQSHERPLHAPVEAVQPGRHHPVHHDHLGYDGAGFGGDEELRRHTRNPDSYGRRRGGLPALRHLLLQSFLHETGAELSFRTSILHGSHRRGYLGSDRLVGVPMGQGTSRLAVVGRQELLIVVAPRPPTFFSMKANVCLICCVTPLLFSIFALRFRAFRFIPNGALFFARNTIDFNLCSDPKFLVS